MRTIETIRTFKRRNFSVVVNAVEDFDLDLSWDEDGSTRKGLESGEFCSFGVVVTVYARGSEIGSDSLWGCIYRTPLEFMDHFGTRVQAREYQAKENRKAKREKREPLKCCICCYFSGMVREAIRNARKEIEKLKELSLREVQS